MIFEADDKILLVIIETLNCRDEMEVWQHVENAKSAKQKMLVYLTI